jgi:GTPase-activator protein for Ras-like GTPase
LVNEAIGLDDDNYEISPNKVSDFFQLEKNQAKVCQLTSKVVHAITESVSYFPKELSHVSALLQRLALEKFGDKCNRNAVIGSLVVLRFISPAIVSPEGWGITLPGSKPRAGLRRGLILVSKSIQVSRCVCVCVCVCVQERKREREFECVNVHMCVHTCVFMYVVYVRVYPQQNLSNGTKARENYMLFMNKEFASWEAKMSTWFDQVADTKGEAYPVQCPPAAAAEVSEVDLDAMGVLHNDIQYVRSSRGSRVCLSDVP